MGESMGRATGVKIGATQLRFVSCTVKKQGTLIQSEGITGTRSHLDGSASKGTYTVGGQIVLEPRPEELAVLLPFILGTGGVLTEALPDFSLTVNKVVGCYTYTGCKINTARFQSSAGQNLRLTLDVQGLDREAAEWSAGTPTVQQPYVHHQCVLTLATSARKVKTIDLLINNALLLDNFNNSQSRTSIDEGDRIVTLTCETPFTADELDLCETKIAGIAGSLVYTNGLKSIGFTLPNLKAPDNDPDINDRTQGIPLSTEFQAYQSADGATAELVVTNV